MPCTDNRAVCTTYIRAYREVAQVAFWGFVVPWLIGAVVYPMLECFSGGAASECVANPHGAVGVIALACHSHRALLTDATHSHAAESGRDRPQTPPPQADTRVQ